MDKHNNGFIHIDVEGLKKDEKLDLRYDSNGRLREIRKQIGLEEDIPAYAVFTNEELAGIAKIEVLTLESLRNVPGIGEKKAEKFGPRFIESLSDEKGR